MRFEGHPESSGQGPQASSPTREYSGSGTALHKFLLQAAFLHKSSADDFTSLRNSPYNIHPFTTLNSSSIQFTRNEASGGVFSKTAFRFSSHVPIQTGSHPSPFQLRHPYKDVQKAIVIFRSETDLLNNPGQRKLSWPDLFPLLEFYTLLREEWWNSTEYSRQLSIIADKRLLRESRSWICGRLRVEHALFRSFSKIGFRRGIDR
ncbi:uncharacterized protein An02g13960 [Aspergillus niger]|uniref:Contig An02c0460, genomic contig n=2 Tax=Aspergillus niger TaxID=5061 RepID=A2QFB6_ASPNC|nr:uncharacterized protein An02g13960 [Aspergillus niger]CAK48827.1 unnamed protein product [Aspergillus niger]